MPQGMRRGRFGNPRSSERVSANGKRRDFLARTPLLSHGKSIANTSLYKKQ